MVVVVVAQVVLAVLRLLLLLALLLCHRGGFLLLHRIWVRLSLVRGMLLFRRRRRLHIWRSVRRRRWGAGARFPPCVIHPLDSMMLFVSRRRGFHP